MPSTIKLRIIEARDLPVMDRKSGLTDAYVSLSFGEQTDKTSICRKTLHPKWDHLFRIDVPDDTILQDEPIRLTVLDKDVYSSDNTIGVVILDLNCLLVAATELKGWYPIFDTLRGVRGYLCVQVKLQFFGDVNPFKSTAAGVVFFCASRLSESEYEVVHIHGFCEELVMAADPEYHWADSFRTSRTSNEARMLLLHQLASTSRRSVGSKALEMGANAVLAYRLEFDFEGEGGIVARGLGTACTIERRSAIQQIYQHPSDCLDRKDSFSDSSPSCSPSFHKERVSGHKSALLHGSATLTPLPFPGTPHVDVDLLSLLNIQRTILKGVVLLTINYLPDHFDLRIGGVVSARSVKILAHKNTDKDLRDKWWQELRNEIRSHARALNCHVVLGYSESSSIIEGDICVLSAIGTAVQCDLKLNIVTNRQPKSVRRRHTPSKISIETTRKRACSVCHITYSRETAPFRMNLMPCVICNKHLVPDMMLATIIPGKRFEMLSGCRMIEARVVRSKKKLQGEANATLISEMIPFIEFDLHRQLMYKLRLLGMNAAFGLRIRLTVGDNLIVAIANATATFLPALPLPPVLRIARSTITEMSMAHAQDLLVSISDRNISKHAELLRQRLSLPAESSSSSDENDEADALDDDQDRQAVVLQIDDEYDEDIVSSLLDPCPPDEMDFLNTDGMGSYHFITADLGSLTAFRRISCNVANSQLNQQLSMAFHDMQAQLTFSVRHSRPVALTCMQAQINIPDENEIDIIMTAQVVRSNPNMDGSELYNEGWPRLLQFPDKPVEVSNEPFDSQVSISALEVCPAGMIIVKCLGRVHLHFINERWLSHDEGGLARYAHQFLAEAHSVLRANVAARGGNCLLSYSVNQFSIAQPRRDQVYCVITVSGDAVLVHREGSNAQ